MITADLLRAATGCTPERAEAFAHPISEACALAEITPPQRLAMFLANVSQESGALRWLEELWGPTEAQKTYEGRKGLGNTQEGDGYRFRGRGCFQTTGRANYRELRPALILAGYEDVPDFEAEPDRLAEPRWAAASAAHYWRSRGLNAYADAGDFAAVCKGINLGNPKSGRTPNGMAERLQALTRAQAALAALVDKPPVSPIQPVDKQPDSPSSPPPAPMPRTSYPAGEGGPQDDYAAPAVQEQPAMADQSSTLGTIAQATGGVLSSGIAGPVGMLAGVLIKAFSPLAKEKLENALERHSDHPEVAQQVAASIVDAVVAATGKADPLEAVVAAKADPAIMQQVEAGALEKLNAMAPLLEKLAALDAQAWKAEEDSREAAAARGRQDAEDLAPKLADRGFQVYAAVLVATAVLIIIQTICVNDHKPSGELVGFFIAVAMLGARQWETLYQYRFGSSRGSSAKDAVIQQLQQRGK